MANRSGFSCRLLQATAGDDSIPGADALCAEAWVRLGAASLACVVRVVGADTLRLTQCHRESADSVDHRVESLVARYSSLLSDDWLRAALPTPAAPLQRQVLSEPTEGWGVVCDRSLEAATAEDAAGVEAALNAVTRRLLPRADGTGCRFPESRLLEALAEFSAGAGHEINNPLGSILGQAAAALRSRPGIELQQALELIGAQAWRIRDMIGNTMLFARPPAVERREVDCELAAREIVQAIQEQPGFETPPVTVEAASDLPRLWADDSQLRTLISCLVRNAIEASNSVGSRDAVRVTIGWNREVDALELCVADRGSGLASDTVRRHLFDPFFSGRPAGRGLGFGLSLSWQIVRRHQGMMFCESAADRGLRVHVGLPLRPDPTARESARTGATDRI